MQLRLLQVFRHRITRPSCLRIYLCSVPEDCGPDPRPSLQSLWPARGKYLVRSLHVCSYHHVGTANKHQLTIREIHISCRVMNKKTAYKLSKLILSIRPLDEIMWRPRTAGGAQIAGMSSRTSTNARPLQPRQSDGREAHNARDDSIRLSS